MKCKQCGKECERTTEGFCDKCAMMNGMMVSTEKRLAHLLKSKFIRSFDNVDQNGNYVRDIKEADRNNNAIEAAEVINRTIGLLGAIGSCAGCQITPTLGQVAVRAAESLDSLLKDVEQ